MNLLLPQITSYSSMSQQIRVSSEPWVAQNIFCPNCEHNSLDSLPNNSPVADFKCNSCKEEYELKSKSGGLGRKITDGQYSTMIERIHSINNPSFFFLTYDKGSRMVKNFIVIPKFYFTTSIIERRKPLSKRARRAGWVGCNIVMDKLPLSGRISYISDGVIQPKEKVRTMWNKTKFLSETANVESKGWLLDIMECVEMIGEKQFNLSQVYAYRDYLQAKHPHNNNIEAKIRQQLQVLRDAGYIRFKERGVYCVT